MLKKLDDLLLRIVAIGHKTKHTGHYSDSTILLIQIKGILDHCYDNNPTMQWNTIAQCKTLDMTFCWWGPK